MRDKIISYGSCVSIFQLNLKRSFGTNSPIDIISGPKAPLLYSWLGNVSYTSSPSVAFGTIYRWRYDSSDPMPLNCDQWVLWSTGTANLVRVKETEKSAISEHWASDLPVDIKTNAPQWVQGYINDMTGNK